MKKLLKIKNKCDPKISTPKNSEKGSQESLHNLMGISSFLKKPNWQFKRQMKEHSIFIFVFPVNKLFINIF